MKFGAGLRVCDGRSGLASEVSEKVVSAIQHNLGLPFGAGLMPCYALEPRCVVLGEALVALIFGVGCEALPVPSKIIPPQIRWQPHIPATEASGLL